MSWGDRVCVAIICVLVIIAIALCAPLAGTAVAAAALAALAALAGMVGMASACCHAPPLAGEARYGGKAGKKKDTGAPPGDGLTDKLLAPEELVEISEAIRANPHLHSLITSAKTMIDYKDIEHRAPYVGTEVAATKILRRVVHNGQLKLVLSEVQFLTRALKYYLDACYVVYAGSAPSHKLGMLAAMFPNVKFVLIDPAEHYIMFDRCGAQGLTTQYSPNRVETLLYFKATAGNRFRLPQRQVNLYGKGVVPRSGQELAAEVADLAAAIHSSPQTMFVIEDVMTEDLARALAPLGEKAPLLFISDIRTQDEATMAPPSNIDILWNSAQHLNWLRHLTPRQYLLKFHPPYPEDASGRAKGLAEYRRRTETHDDFRHCADAGIDFIKDYEEGRFEYMAGDHIFIQAYAPLNSTETRLFGAGYDMVPYDMVEFEERMRFYNVFHRPLGNHHGAAVYEDYRLGLDRCGDCAVATAILSDYLAKNFGAVDPSAVKTLFQETLASIGRSVFGEFGMHGVDDIHRMLPTEGYNAEVVMARLLGNYTRRMLRYEPAWAGRETLAEALRWAELRDLVGKALEPYWADGRPAASARVNTYPAASEAVRPIVNSAKMGYLFGAQVAEYSIYMMVSKFLGNTPDTARLTQQVKDLIYSTSYKPVVTKGFQLLADGFQTDTGGPVKIPPMLRGLYTPQQYATDLLFTEGVSPPRWMGGVTRNCRVDAAIAAAAADIKNRLRAPATMVEVCTTPRGYYAWRAGAGANGMPIKGVNDYAQRCIWGAAEDQVLDWDEVHGAEAIILIFLFSLPMAANDIIGEHIRKANPLSHVIIVSRWRDLVPNAEYAMPSQCSVPDGPSGCGNEACKEKACYAMFMNATPPLTRSPPAPLKQQRGRQRR
jgi:hypothetical protein